MATVSVVMAAHNTQRFIAKSVESILSQTYSDFDLILVDDASSDGTFEEISRYAREDSRVSSFRNQVNMGAQATFSLGIKYSNALSPFIITAGSDDWWDPDLLKTLVHEAEAHENVALVHGDCWRTDSEGNVTGRHSSIFSSVPSAGVHRDIRSLLRNCYIAGNTTLINRRLAAGLYWPEWPFDPKFKYTGDYHFWLQLLLRGASAFYVDEPLGYYRKHPGELTTDSNLVGRLAEEVLMLNTAIRPLVASEDLAFFGAVLGERVRALTFELLKSARIQEARTYAGMARRLSDPFRLDISAVRIVLALPVSQNLKARLWNSLVRLRGGV